MFLVNLIHRHQATDSATGAFCHRIRSELLRSDDDVEFGGRVARSSTVGVVAAPLFTRVLEEICASSWNRKGSLEAHSYFYIRTLGSGEFNIADTFGGNQKSKFIEAN